MRNKRIVRTRMHMIVYIFTTICITLYMMTGPAASARAADAEICPVLAYDAAISKIDNSEMKIALTFDDGPHPQYTEQILDLLKEFGIHATFFIVGENAERYPDLLRRETAEGHEIGNHTFTHPDLRKIRQDSLVCQLSDTARAIEKAGAALPRLFRPPTGRCNEIVMNAARQMGYHVVLWTVDTRDWDKTTTVESVTDNILENVAPGSIILCHDYVVRPESVTIRALRQVIPRLLEQGYQFVTVSELISCQ